MPEPVVRRRCASCGTEWETPQSFAPPTLPRIEGEVRPTEVFQRFPSQERKRSKSELAKAQAFVAKVFELSKCPRCGLSVYGALPPRPDQMT